MATILGDVQYSQDGTVTNPCFFGGKFHSFPMKEPPYWSGMFMEFPRFSGDFQFCKPPFGFVWKCRVPRKTQWFCWSLSLLNGYFIGGIPHFQTYPNLVLWFSSQPRWAPTNHPTAPSVSQRSRDCGRKRRPGRNSSCDLVHSPASAVRTMVGWHDPEKKVGWNRLPSGKHTKNYGKSSFFKGKSTISMAIFNSYVKLPEGIWFNMVGGWYTYHWLR